MTPQERWWIFREHLPTLTRWQKIMLAVATAVFMVGGLPFLLPLAGKTVPSETLSDPDGKFTSLVGHQVYYVHAPAPGEAVILVHGFGGGTIDWRSVIPALEAAGYDTYALDLPGYGLSEKGLEIDMSHPAQAEAIRVFMAAQGIESAHLVGHSTGANVILYFAQRYPEQVKTLTLVDAMTATTVTPQLPPWLFKNAIVQRWARCLLRWVIPVSVEPQLRSAARHDEIVNAALVADYQRALYTENWELSLLGIARDSYRNTLPEPLNAIHKPVLILWGAMDGWASPSEGDHLKAEIPGARLVTFPGAGHLPMHEVPADFSRTLVAFLRESQ